MVKHVGIRNKRSSSLHYGNIEICSCRETTSPKGIPKRQIQRADTKKQAQWEDN